MPVKDFIAEQLSSLEASSRLRALRTVSGAQGSRITLDGQPVVNFSSNNYLGLANHPQLVDAGHAALTRAGGGSGASRLIVGNESAHEALELAVANFHQAPAARLFNSGYHVNTGVIPALVGASDVVFSDALNHASIIDGCRLSRAEVVVYPHGDVAALGRLMAAHPGRRQLVVSDSVFSMDGDFAPLVELAGLCRRADALLMVDEAHAVGAVGPGGRGACAAVNVTPDVLVGTLGKAFGSFGAYVVGDVALCSLLLNRARSFVFTTALPPSVAAMGIEGVRLAGSPLGEQLRGQLAARIEEFSVGLKRMGLLADGSGASAIFPVVIGDESATMRVCGALLDRGLYAQGIRPPTVAPGSSRLRVALMASHTAEEVAALLEALVDLVGSTQQVARQSLA